MSEMNGEAGGPAVMSPALAGPGLVEEALVWGTLSWHWKGKTGRKHGFSKKWFFLKGWG